MKKQIFTGLIVVFILVQFIKIDKNESSDLSYNISKSYPVSNELSQLLKVSCYDCHSNNTSYPWYSKIQPVAWWLDHHVQDGKKHLNFSEFTKSRIAVQNHKFEEIIEMVNDKEMPLVSYTYFGLHPKANLTDKQRDLIVNWGIDQMNFLKNNFPVDSLIF
ncbi:MAG: heme-binding domain-containing protein [Bacteroidetes bacterium]|jgi:hypothetical protein|nr:MAG: cytochrome C [Cryomorphaceae bacterium BACL29 MAG-121220-bin8]MDA1019825.1 heme-binding domain-containing protein [Bacteroidota bacterium]|tara:strand:- start:36668 stop:37150 length:483 start_codon:yes stop_codon:yes gene_type:complete